MTAESMRAVQPLTVGQVAEEYAVTVRALHHYDQVGLLRPSQRSPAGYRLYTATDLDRLAHVVTYRRLGFSLEEIAELLEDVGSQGVEGSLGHLRRQRESVMARLDEMTGLVRAIDHAMERVMEQRPATTEDLKEIFGEQWDEQDGYRHEAEHRWGDTAAWAQGQERTARMTRADWAEVKDETVALERDLAAACAGGEDPPGPVAAALVERHRASVERFYDCSPAMQLQLVRTYVADPRFIAHYEGLQPGLTRWLHDAVVASARREGVATD